MWFSQLDKNLCVQPVQSCVTSGQFLNCVRKQAEHSTRRKPGGNAHRGLCFSFCPPGPCPAWAPAQIYVDDGLLTIIWNKHFPPKIVFGHGNYHKKKKANSYKYTHMLMHTHTHEHTRKHMCMCSWTCAYTHTIRIDTSPKKIHEWSIKTQKVLSIVDYKKKNQQVKNQNHGDIPLQPKLVHYKQYRNEKECGLTRTDENVQMWSSCYKYVTTAS